MYLSEFSLGRKLGGGGGGRGILWCNHSNETSSAVLLNGPNCFSVFYIFTFDFWYYWEFTG